MRFLMIPGIGGSDPEHWQSRWQRELLDAADRIEPRSWDRPDEPDWWAAIEAKATADTVLVAHSLGCLAATSWLVSGGAAAAGAFLVAPPDPASAAFPPAASGFGLVTRRLEIPAVVVASSDDPYGTVEHARRAAAAWGAQFVDAGAVGHIGTESGVGDWPAGRARLDQLAAGLDGRFPRP
jgi:predicted alpha/beta hydrolase family esterase